LVHGRAAASANRAPSNYPDEKDEIKAKKKGKKMKGRMDFFIICQYHLFLTNRINEGVSPLRLTHTRKGQLFT
jgi:hypothetical protein